MRVVRFGTELRLGPDFAGGRGFDDMAHRVVLSVDEGDHPSTVEHVAFFLLGAPDPIWLKARLTDRAWNDLETRRVGQYNEQVFYVHGGRIDVVWASSPDDPFQEGDGVSVADLLECLARWHAYIGTVRRAWDREGPDAFLVGVELRVRRGSPSVRTVEEVL